MTIPMFQKKSHTHVEKGRSQLSAWQLQEGGESDACWHLFGSLELKKCTDLGLALGAYKNSSICISWSSKSRPISSGFQRNTSVEAVYKQSETVWRMAHDFETRKLGALDQKKKKHCRSVCVRTIALDHAFHLQRTRTYRPVRARRASSSMKKGILNFLHAQIRCGWQQPGSSWSKPTTSPPRRRRWSPRSPPRRTGRLSLIFFCFFISAAETCMHMMDSYKIQ